MHLCLEECLSSVEKATPYSEMYFIVWEVQDRGFARRLPRVSRQPLCSSRVRLLRSASRGALLISKDGDSTLPG